jgi:hypothetical protein
VAPDLVIVKNRDSTQEWPIGSDEINSGSWAQYLGLSDISGESGGASRFNSTAPTSTVVSIGTSDATNKNTENHIMYCFHSVDGYSKIGSYTGNNNADGPFIYTGFRPAWVMVKSYSAGGTHYDWPIYDSARSTYNPVGNVLEANQSQAEITGSGRGLPIDFLSNGFKHRSSYGENNSTASYIYLAFAESPFKYSNAR